MRIADRYKGVIGWFESNMPEPQTELHYSNPYELLIAVILSAQCTDKRVNMVTPRLFEAFPDAATLAAATEEEVFPYIQSVSYPNNKTRHICAAAKMLVNEFGGEVPSEFDSLIKLPGVGRKTANVILSVVWNQATMAVDTHVFRVSNRIGLTRGSKNPLQTEKTLIRHIPVDKVPRAHHWLILHGRYICTSRSPKCEQCGIAEYCRYRESKAKNPE